MRPWKKLVEEVRKPKPTVKVALVGKYVELQDAYMSVREALKHAGLANGVEI
jgi:CTP synthase